MDKEQADRRLDYLWAIVCANYFQEGLNEGVAADQAADAAVKRADLAEAEVRARRFRSE